MLIFMGAASACDTSSIEGVLRSTERIRWVRRVGGVGFDEPQAVVAPSSGAACTWVVLDSTAPPAPGLERGLHLIQHDGAGRVGGMLAVDEVLDPLRIANVQVASDGRGRAALGASVSGPDVTFQGQRLQAQGGALEGLLLVDSTPRECDGVPFDDAMTSGWSRRFGDRGAVRIQAVHFRGDRILVAGHFTQSFTLPLRPDSDPGSFTVTKRGEPGDRDVFLMAFDAEGRLLQRSVRVLGGPGDDTVTAADLTPLGFQWIVAGRFEQELGVGARFLFEGGDDFDVFVVRLTGLNLTPPSVGVEPLFSSGVADAGMDILSVSAGDLFDGEGRATDANFVFAGTLSEPRTLGGRQWRPVGQVDGYVFAASTRSPGLVGWLTQGSSAESVRSTAITPDGVWVSGSFRSDLPLGDDDVLSNQDGLGAYAVLLQLDGLQLVPVDGLSFGLGRTAGGPLAFVSADEDLITAATAEGTVDFPDGSVESKGRSDMMLIRFGAPLPEGSTVFVP